LFVEGIFVSTSPFSHRRVGVAVTLLGVAVVIVTRPSPFDRATRIADAPWADIDDLWPLRLALSPLAHAGDASASLLLAKVLTRLGEPTLATTVSSPASAAATASATVSATAPAPLLPTRERLLAATAIEQNNATAIRHWLSKTWRTDFVWSARMLARLETLEGRPAIARLILATLRRDLPRHRYLEREVARTYTAEQRFVDAAHAIRREIAAAPAEARPYWELATIALHAKDLPLAYETYQDLFRNVPAEPDAPYYVCEMARHVKSADEALAICAPARRLRPGDTRIALEIARNLTLLGRTNEAQAILVADRDRAPTRPEPWRSLLTWEFENGFFDAAHRVATHAAAWFPSATWRTEALDRVRRERASVDFL
jgi:predicted Zn-dependent protease